MAGWHTLLPWSILAEAVLAGLTTTAEPAPSSPPNATAEVPGGPVKPSVDPAKAYLFAHMTKEHYGVLFYSVSLNGFHWRRINGGRSVSTDYHGHASIAQGATDAISWLATSATRTRSSASGSRTIW
jgi:hypothetical protein